MTGLLLWLSAFFFTRSIAHPITTSNDWPTTAQTSDWSTTAQTSDWLDSTNLNNWSPPKEAAFVTDSTSITRPYQVAATFKGGDDSQPGESLNSAEGNFREALGKYLDKLYEGRIPQDSREVDEVYSDEWNRFTDRHMKAYDQKIKETCDEIDEAIAKGTYGGLEREARERNEAARRIGQTPEGNENPPETEKTEFRAPTEEDLKRFTAAAVAAFPQYAEIKIGLAGFELTIAILTALPGFVVEHLPWNPATAGI